MPRLRTTHILPPTNVNHKDKTDHKRNTLLPWFGNANLHKNLCSKKVFYEWVVTMTTQISIWGGPPANRLTKLLSRSPVTVSYQIFMPSARFSDIILLFISHQLVDSSTTQRLIYTDVYLESHKRWSYRKVPLTTTHQRNSRILISFVLPVNQNYYHHIGVKQVSLSHPYNLIEIKLF